MIESLEENKPSVQKGDKVYLYVPTGPLADKWPVATYHEAVVKRVYKYTCVVETQGTTWDFENDSREIFDIFSTTKFEVLMPKLAPKAVDYRNERVLFTLKEAEEYVATVNLFRTRQALMRKVGSCKDKKQLTLLLSLLFPNKSPEEVLTECGI